MCSTGFKLLFMLSNRLEAKIKMKDGVSICLHIFRSSTESSRPKGIFLVTHGQGEHGLAYEKTVSKLNPDFEYWCWDLRGHGSSDGQRGYVNSFSEYVSDWIEISQLAQRENSTVVLMGHSMGGLITALGLKSLSPHQLQWAKALILSSPLFGLALKVPKIKQKAAELLHSSRLPITLGNEIEVHQLKRNPLTIAEHARDHLRHQKISAGAYLGMLSAFEDLRDSPVDIEIPTFLNLGLKDPIIDLNLARDISKSHFKPIVISEFPDALHEPLNDFEQDLVCERITKFILSL